MLRLGPFQREAASIFFARASFGKTSTVVPFAGDPPHFFLFFPPTAESFGVSAQIGSRVVRGGPEVRFHEGSTRVPRGFHQGSRRVLSGFHEVLRGLRGGASAKKSTACWGYHLRLFFFNPTKKGSQRKARQFPLGELIIDRAYHLSLFKQNPAVSLSDTD